MPSKIDWRLFCVGFFTSAGWAIAALVGRILSAV
jgi:hypothetical protein